MTRRQLLYAILLFFLFDCIIAWRLYKQQKNSTQIPERQVVEQQIKLTKKKNVAAIRLLGDTLFRTGHSVKSVLFDPKGRYLYSMNLEEGSVFAFERKTKKLAYKLVFDRTPAKGYDYGKRQWVKGSFAEKPVEACFTHGGEFLWISWHNGDGVVAWPVGKTGKGGNRQATLHQHAKKERIPLYYFPTGSTPKVMIANRNRMYVANWHGQSISEIHIEGNDPEQWKTGASLKVGGTPRGLCFAEGNKLLVAQMASGYLASVSTDSLALLGRQFVGPTPRHLARHDSTIYASLSSAEQLVALHQKQGRLEVARVAKTADDPRTLVCSPDGQLLFLACYGADLLQVFRARDFKLLGQFPCKGSPVGLDVWQEGNSIEVWVANYRYDTIKLFTFEATQ